MKYIFCFLVTVLTFLSASAQSGKSVNSRTIKVEEQYLNLPVRTGAKGEHLDIYYKGKKVREILIELDGEKPDFWVNLDMSEWKGGNIDIKAEDATAAKYLGDLYQSKSPAGKETFYKEPLRPKYHFTATRGWFNDPNGMVYSDGKWHLFFQHNPYGWNWNNMTWGHAVSSDLMHWTETGDAIHPDEKGTIFSGSAIVDRENVLGLQKGNIKTLVAYFTYAGNSGHNWSKDAKTVQAMAYSTDNGKTWVKYAKNPVIPNLYGDNRDPKAVWDESGKQWIMALYLGDANPEHAFALFSSKNLIDWKEIQRFTVEGERECPDFFPIKVEGTNETKWLFTGANKVYVIGDFVNNKFTPITKPKHLDRGNNYYAAQTFFNTPEKNVIQIGWMAGCNFPKMPFNQQISFPREIKLFKDGDNYTAKCMPVKEIAALFSSSHFSVSKKNLSTDDNPTTNYTGDSYVLDAVFDVNDSKGDGFGFLLDGFEVYYSIKNKKLIFNATGMDKKEIDLTPDNGKVSFRILADIGSFEVFANNGEVAAAFAYLPVIKTNKVTTIIRGERVVMDNLSINEIGSTWNK